MIQNNIVRFISALAPSKWGILALVYCLAISGCGLEEPYGGLKDNDDVIEFVARPVGFNNQAVETKAAANTFESAIYSCYLLVFDSNSGNLLQRSEASLNQNIKLNVKSGNIKACFLVNVTKTFAENIKGITRPEGSTDDPNFYLNSAVLDITYADHTAADNDMETRGIIGVPSVNFGGTIGTKKCLPMYGEWSGSVSGQSTIQVPIKRLFAKIAVDVKLVLASSGSEFGDAFQKYTSFKLMSYELKNLPSKVKLVESGNQSSWVKDEDSDSFATSSGHVFMLGGLNQSIKNNGSTSFYLYVPEYYLTALDKEGYTNQNADVDPETYDTQEYKPLMFETGKKPIYITILGQYSPYELYKVNLTYDIYLGENETNSFTLKRNTCYTNTITITGANNSKDGSGTSIDHRVNAVTINDPTVTTGEAANCYIYTANGKYSFPTYKGAYTSLNEARKNMCVGGVKVVKKTQTNLSNLTPVEITELTYSNDEISFNLSTGTGGNVILELQDAAGNAIWSWHLWVLVLGDNDNIGIADQTLPNGVKMMNRNLGSYTMTTALTEGLGLYYQYGNKNPYIGGTYAGGGSDPSNTWDPSADSNKNDATKAVNDPCPPGYKVPDNAESTWSSTTSFQNIKLDFTGLFSEGVLRVYNSPESVMFPYSAYQGASSASKTQNDIPIYIEQELSGTLVSHKFKQITVKSDLTSTYGAIWTDKSTKAREYYYAAIKFEDLVSNFTFLKGWVSTWVFVKWGEYKYKERLSTSELISLGTLLTFSSDQNSYDLVESTYEDNTGLQVRCVRHSQTNTNASNL